MSRACSLGVFGTQLGTAAGFLVPPVVVKNHEDVRKIGDDLSILTYGTGIFASVVAFAVVICKNFIFQTIFQELYAK